jgi:hypothetical protein
MLVPLHTLRAHKPKAEGEGERERERSRKRMENVKYFPHVPRCKEAYDAARCASGNVSGQEILVIPTIL